MWITEVANQKILFLLVMLLLILLIKSLFPRFFNKLLDPNAFLKISENSVLFLLLNLLINSIFLAYLIVDWQEKPLLFDQNFWLLALFIFGLLSTQFILIVLVFQPYFRNFNMDEWVNASNYSFIFLCVGLILGELIFEYVPYFSDLKVYSLLIIFGLYLLLSAAFRFVFLLIKKSVPLNLYILYLCTLEIAPLGLFIKYILNYSLV